MRSSMRIPQNAIRNIFIPIAAIAILIILSSCSAKEQANAKGINDTEGEQKMVNIDGVNIEWLGQSGFVFKNEKIIYIDPFQMNGEQEKADIIFITHEHYDHCSIADLAKIVKPDTIIVTVPDCQSKLSNFKVKNVTLVRPGNRLNIQGTEVEVVPAYNSNKRFHPKENEWVGYIIKINGKRIYHAGDTDALPELKNLSNIDIALVPVSGTYTMTAEDAANLVSMMKPKVAVPMHYGSVSGVGSDADAARFKNLAKVRVEILQRV